MSFLVLASPLAFSNFGAFGITALFSSYLIPNTLLLYHRMTGGIMPYSSSSTTITNTISAEGLTWGPWKLPEPLGTIVHAFGCVYMTITIFFTFWPEMPDPDLAQMNWDCALMAVLAAFLVFKYLFSARHRYTGPILEVDGTTMR
jgi:choline transport protein